MFLPICFRVCHIFIVLLAKAAPAGPVARSQGRCFVGEEDTVLDVFAIGDESKSRGTVESAIDFLFSVTAEGPLGGREILISFPVDELIHLLFSRHDNSQSSLLSCSECFNIVVIFVS